MLKYFIFLFICISSFLFSKDNFYVCAIFHNEARFLDEWVTFHLKEGAEKIYMYNNNSDDGYTMVLYKYLITGKVVLIPWNRPHDNAENWNSVQCAAYMDCIDRVKGKVKWIAFIDTDEFLFSPTGKRFSDIFKTYDDCDQIGANWVMYGTSGIQKLAPKEMLTTHMVMRGQLDNAHVKSIVRPDKVLKCVNPHFFILKPNSKTINENHESMEGCFHPHSSNILRINHYWVRDIDFMYNEKLKRQKKWAYRTLEELTKIESTFNEIYDPILQNWR